MSRLLVSACLLLTLENPTIADEPPGTVSFVREVLPVLRDNCFGCHDVKNRKGKYEMTTFAQLVKGGSRGEAVVAGKPEESLLWTLASGQEEPKMPPKEANSRITPQQIALFERWIKEGARFDGADPKASLNAELRRQWRPPTPPQQYTRPVTVRSLAFSPDGKFLLAGGYYEILIWEASTGKLVARLRTRAERANAMHFVDAQTLAVAGGRPGQEGDVRLYRLELAELVKSWEVVTLDGTAANSPHLLKELIQTEDEILTLAFNPEGQRLAAAGCDRTIRVWDLKQDYKLIQTIEIHADWVVKLAFTPDGQRLFTASRDKTAKVWDFSTKATIATFAGHQTTVNDLLPEQGGRQGISVGDDGQVRFWRLEGNQQQMQVRALPGHTKGVYQLAKHPTQPRIATAGADGMIRLWTLPNGTPQRTLIGHKDWVYALTFSPDGNRLASGAWNGEIRLWDVAKGTMVRLLLAGPGLHSSETKPL